MEILNRIFGIKPKEVIIKPKEVIQLKYNSYHKKHNNEDMFVYQRYVSNPNFTDENPYKAKVIAIFRNIRPKIGISSINFTHDNPVVLYDRKEIDRYMSIYQKRIYS